MSAYLPTPQALEEVLRIILPEQYHGCYEDVQAVSMGSAGLKYGPDGKVAWDRIWTTFCDLAMAGGPPHKGKLLEAGRAADIEAQPEAYRQIVEEICYGIGLAAGLKAESSPSLGWIQIDCESHAMAGWLTRAIVMENVSARCHGAVLELPAGPSYRLEKEVKNVITSAAKTYHYWFEHMEAEQHREIANLFARMNITSPLIQPAWENETAQNELCDKIAREIQNTTGLRSVDPHPCGWLGLECGHVRLAIWMMRALSATNAISRREETVLFIPVNASLDPDGNRVTDAVIQIYRFAVARNIV